MNQASETRKSALNCSKSNSDTPKIHEIHKTKKVKKLKAKGTGGRKRKLKQFHVHTFCLATKDGKTIKDCQLMSEVIHRDRRRTKLGKSGLRKMVQGRDFQQIRLLMIAKENQLAKSDQNLGTTSENVSINQENWPMVQNLECVQKYSMNLDNLQREMNWFMRGLMGSFPTYIMVPSWTGQIW